MRSRFVLPMVAGLALGVAPLASAQLGKPSASQQIQLGKQAAAEIRRKERVLPSYDSRVRTVRRIGQRLLSGSRDRGPWEYSFDVIDNKQMNAFALPGGPTFIYTGLLDKLKTEDDVAGVMAHELTHVQRQHWASQYAEQQRRNLGLGVLLSIFRVNRSLSTIAGIGNSLLTLRYSRDKESEADNRGFDMMANAGFNPQGMADVFQILAQQARSGRTPEFLSTHPSDSNRIRRIESRIQQSGDRYPPERSLAFRD